MRYVSQYDDLALYRNDGSIAHKFHNGVLVIGDVKTRNGTNSTTSTKGFTVDHFAYAADPGHEIQGIRKDYSGLEIDESGARRIECIGLGSLEKKNYVGSALASLLTGYDGTFFEAPILDNNATLPATVNILYEVLSDDITYDGVTYKTGQVFVSNGVTSVTGDGTFALSIKVLKNLADQYTKEAFAINHLVRENDAVEYWNSQNGGYTPIDSLMTPDFNFIGRNTRLMQ